MFSTPSDPFAAVAFRVGVAALLLVLLMLALIVVLRFRLQHRQKREAAFNAVWRPLLVEAVSADVLLTSLPELPRSDEVFFFRLWNYLQASLRGSANERLNRVARHLRCDQYARADLQRGNRTDRLMAIIMLGQLRDMDAWDLLAHQAGLPDSLASLNAARALVQIDPLKAIGLLLPMLVSRKDWDINQVANFLGGPTQQAFYLLLRKNILQLKRQDWLRALQLAAALRLALPEKIMRTVMVLSPDVQTLAAAMNLAADLSLRPQIRKLLGHENWLVRVQATRFLGFYGDDTDVESLKNLLQDPQWWTRFEAAQSLLRMPFFGRQKLLLLRDQVQGTQELAMLDHVLAEAMLAPGST